MARRIRHRLSYANIVATLALFVALGGASYAVTHLKRNSVGPKQIRPGAVNTSELHKGAVKGTRLACPAGMPRVADLCYEGSDRTQANWTTAVQACAAAQLRLPSIPEGLLIARQLPVPAPPSHLLWTSLGYQDSTAGLVAAAIRSVTLTGITISYSDATGATTYRCVVSAGS